jgi:hypothetical protein
MHLSRMKLKVVTRLTEKEATGGKALAHYRARCGLSKTTKVPYLDVDLFHKDYNKKECVYWDISTWEKSQFQHGAEDYLHDFHPSTEHNIRLCCQNCRRFQCHWCVEGLVPFLHPGEQDHEAFNGYVAAAPASEETLVSSCSCCCMKSKRKANDANRHRLYNQL